jgi:chromosomal replication initiation ATPase DnaA
MTMSQLSQSLFRAQQSINGIKHQLLLLQKKDADRIVNIVEDKYGLPRGSVYKKTKKREIAEPRQISMILIDHTTEMTVRKIGSLFELDHSAVSSAKKAIRNFYETNAVVRNTFTEICHELHLTDEDINKIITNT